MAATQTASRLPDLLAAHEPAILESWIALQLASNARRPDLIDEKALRHQARVFLREFRAACQNGPLDDIQSPAWKAVRDVLSALSSERAALGFNPAETAIFIFSLKEPVFSVLEKAIGRDGPALGRELWTATTLLDRLGLFTTEVHANAREELITRQNRDMLELSTPVVTLWDDILALPLIGTLDSARTQVVMESLLQRIVDTGSRIAILDITGVPTVDTLVAQHLLKTVAAARLMGADCIISGIRPQIAQTIVHLGVDLGHVTTKSTLREAFAVALARTHQRVGEPAARKAAPHLEHL